ARAAPPGPLPPGVRACAAGPCPRGRPAAGDPRPRRTRAGRPGSPPPGRGGRSGVQPRPAARGRALTATLPARRPERRPLLVREFAHAARTESGAPRAAAMSNYLITADGEHPADVDRGALERRLAAGDFFWLDLY